MPHKSKAWLASLALVAAMAAGAQTTPNDPSGSASGTPQPPSDQAKSPETHISPQQARELFSSVGPILQFASEDTRLPIRRQVKPHLTTRAEVDKYLLE